MPRPHLLALILRLVIGVVILGVVGFLLFSKLKPRKQVTIVPSPQPSESPVIIVEPTPTPIYPTLPSEPEPTTTPTPDTQSPQKPGRQIIRVQRIITQTEVTNGATAQASSSANGSSASATATAGGASASASASSN